jgi:hypothetical protein
MKSLEEKDVTPRECGVGLSRAGKFKGIYGVNESTIRFKRKNYCQMWEASRSVRHLISFWENHCPETVNNFQGAGSPTSRMKQDNMQGGLKGRGRKSCDPQSRQQPISVVSQGLCFMCISCVPSCQSHGYGNVSVVSQGLCFMRIIQIHV